VIDKIVTFNKLIHVGNTVYYVSKLIFLNITEINIIINITCITIYILINNLGILWEAIRVKKGYLPKFGRKFECHHICSPQKSYLIFFYKTSLLTRVLVLKVQSKRSLVFYLHNTLNKIYYIIKKISTHFVCVH